MHLGEGRVSNSTRDIITAVTLTSRTASSSAREATARISDEGLKVREVTEVSRFITDFRGFGLAELRHASCE